MREWNEPTKIIKFELGPQLFDILILADSNLDAAFTRFTEEFLTPENVEKSLTENNPTMSYDFCRLTLVFSNSRKDIIEEFKAKFKEANKDQAFVERLTNCRTILNGKDDLLKQFRFILSHFNTRY